MTSRNSGKNSTHINDFYMNLCAASIGDYVICSVLQNTALAVAVTAILYTVTALSGTNESASCCADCCAGYRAACVAADCSASQCADCCATDAISCGSFSDAVQPVSARATETIASPYRVDFMPHSPRFYMHVRLTIFITM